MQLNITSIQTLLDNGQAPYWQIVRFSDNKALYCENGLIVRDSAKTAAGSHPKRGGISCLSCKHTHCRCKGKQKWLIEQNQVIARANELSLSSFNAAFRPR